MFFPLSKVIYFLITPSNFLMLVGLIGCLLLFTESWRGIGRLLAIGGFAGLLFAGLSPLAHWVTLPLEQRFPTFAEDGRPVTGIVVLGGGIETRISAERGQLTVSDPGERQIALGDLARRYPQARLMFSGGSGGLYDDGIAESDIVSRFAGTLGVPEGRVIFEKRSRNTRENAVYSAEIAKPQLGEHWLLVTSAWHMPRAVGCFRKAGFEVVAYPVDFRTSGPRDATRFNRFASDGLFQLDVIVKEWIGLIAYRLAGYIDDWMPAP